MKPASLGAVAALGAIFLLGGNLKSSADPLSDNLKRLQERAKANKGAKAAPKRPRPVYRPRPRVVARPKPQPPSSNAPVAYGGDRLGSKPKMGDLVVNCAHRDGQVHVYLKMRLVSHDGDGQAKVPDIAPGKVPVLVFNPEKGQRRTFYVVIRPNSVATLNASL